MPRDAAELAKHAHQLQAVSQETKRWALADKETQGLRVDLEVLERHQGLTGEAIRVQKHERP